MKIETNYQCISGVCDASHFDHYSKDSIQLAQERGHWPYEDGLYKMWVDCKVIDKFTKNKLFGGRKYYFVLNLMGTTKELQVNQSNYYNQSEVNEIHVYSEDGKTWFPTRI
jgi:hypothetical protein